MRDGGTRRRERLRQRAERRLRSERIVHYFRCNACADARANRRTMTSAPTAVLTAALTTESPTSPVPTATPTVQATPTLIPTDAATATAPATATPTAPSPTATAEPSATATATRTRRPTAEPTATARATQTPALLSAVSTGTVWALTDNSVEEGEQLFLVTPDTPLFVEAVAGDWILIRPKTNTVSGWVLSQWLELDGEIPDDIVTITP